MTYHSNGLWEWKTVTAKLHIHAPRLIRHIATSCNLGPADLRPSIPDQWQTSCHWLCLRSCCCSSGSGSRREQQLELVVKDSCCGFGGGGLCDKVDWIELLELIPPLDVNSLARTPRRWKLFYSHLMGELTPKVLSNRPLHRTLSK